MDYAVPEQPNLVDRVLQQINAVRVSLGGSALKRIRPGKKGDANHCPIANSVKDVLDVVNVDGDVLGRVDDPERFRNASAALGIDPDPYWEEEMRSGYGSIPEIPATEEMQDFISKFDGGEIPKLEEDDLSRE